jgi:hypothetical protein
VEEMKGNLSVHWGIFLLLVGLNATGRCDSLCRRVLPFLGFVDVQGDGACSEQELDLWRENRERWIAFSLEGEDILRKYAEGIRLARFSGESGELSISLPVIRGEALHHFRFQVFGKLFQYNGRSRGEGWSGGLRREGKAGRMQYVVGREGYRFGVSILWEESAGRNQEVRLEEFPHDRDDRDMNRFFLDLLEPTFGREIVYNWEERRQEVEVGGVWALPEGSQMGIKVRFEDGQPRAKIAYNNSGFRKELRGRRQADLKQKWSGWRGEMAIEHRLTSSWYLRPELGWASQKWEAAVRQRDVPESAGGVLLDLLELGDGEGRWQGLDLKLRGTWNRSEQLRAEWVLGWGRSTFSGGGKGTTPVLGFSLRTLPISHRGEMELSGAITSRAGGFRAKREWKGFGLDVGAMAAYAEIEARVWGEGEMEFGLSVNPLQDVLSYDLELYRFLLTPSAQIADWGYLEYEITQYLVELTQRGKSREKNPGEKTRGGTSHRLILKYLL